MTAPRTPTLTRLATFQRAEATAEMSLLRAHSFSWVVTLLATHLGAGPVEVSRFHEVVEATLEDLRAAGSEGADVPRTAREYCNDWVARRWINRSYVDGVELYTLTASTLDVIVFAERLVDRRSTVSQSRLKLILDAVADLADDVNPDTSTRIDRIDQRIAELEQQRAALSEGRHRPTTQSQVREQVTGILDLARHLPADFRRVADSVYEMHRRFVGEVQDDGAGRGQSLQEFFADHDLLESSDEGKAFRGLEELWRNYPKQVALRRDITTLLAQDVAELSAEERTALRSLPRMLVDSAEDVQDTYRRLTQSLERFVHNQSSEDRELRSRLAAAQNAAHSLLGTRTRRGAVDVQLGAVGADVVSVTQLQVADPRLRAAPPDLAELDADTDPSLSPGDVRELGGPAIEDIRAAVSQARARHERRSPTLAEVWDAMPRALRRPKNVIGLLHVATQDGAVFLEDRTIRLHAVRPDGSRVIYTIPWAAFRADSEPVDCAQGQVPAVPDAVPHPGAVPHPDAVPRPGGVPHPGATPRPGGAAAAEPSPARLDAEVGRAWGH